MIVIYILPEKTPYQFAWENREKSNICVNIITYVTLFLSTM